MISHAVLESIYQSFDEDGYKFFNIYQRGDYITGVYLNKTKNILDVLHRNQPVLNSQVNSNVVFHFVEIDVVLRGIIQGQLDSYRLLSHSSEIQIPFDKERRRILDTIKNNFPLFYFNQTTIDKIDGLLENEVYDIDEFNFLFEDIAFIQQEEFTPYDAESLDDYLQLRVILQTKKQELESTKVPKISQNIFDELNEYLVSLRMAVYNEENNN